MTKYSTLNLKWCNSQLNKIKSGITKGTDAFFNLSSKLIRNSKDAANFPSKLLLIITR